MINYTDDNYTIRQYERHLNDGVVLYVTAPSGKDSATLTIKTSVEDEYSETHSLHNGQTTFNLSEYFKESMGLDWRRLVYVHEKTYLPIPRYNSKSDDINNGVSPKAMVDTLTLTIGDDVIDLTNSGLEVYYGYTKCSGYGRLHLFNPNYECIAEFLPTDNHVSSVDPVGFTLFGLCFNRNNGGAIDWYRHDVGSNDTVRQVRMNDYWDSRYNQEGIMLDFVTNEKATGTVSYIVDTRTSGAYIRFLDAEGFLQQILLDIESYESTYEEGELIEHYDGDERFYKVDSASGASICNGHGKTTTRMETNCIHCSMTNLAQGMIDDMKAICMSPLVLLYRGKDDDGNMKWERVRVVPNGPIVLDTKKATISAKIDIYPSFENSYGI